MPLRICVRGVLPQSTIDGASARDTGISTTRGNFPKLVKGTKQSVHVYRALKLDPVALVEEGDLRIQLVAKEQGDL